MTIEEDFKKEILDAIEAKGRYFGVPLEDVRDEVRLATQSITCVDISARKNHRELTGRVEVLEDGIKQILEDNQEFFVETRMMRTDISNLDRRVTVLENNN